VIVWDDNHSRSKLIKRILSECGAQPRWIDGLSAIEGLEPSSSCGVALVGIGSRPNVDDFALSPIRTLKQRGFKIISYEGGAHSWPLGLQCLPLLAGSLRLLDSTSADFVPELRLLLGQLLQAETTRRGEEELIKGVMTELGIVGESQAMISIVRWILRVSILSDLPILITGETGTGKQILANAIYQLDARRRNGPFVALNCGAISPTLVESELFGHRRGAFTGADRDRKGLIRSAHGGILFLDEIGELDDALQTKLLRMLQEKRVLGIGDDQETSVDVRVIAATNRDLCEMVQQRRFRADLFHRLNVLSIHVPPLRERRADVKPLVNHFLRSYQPLNTVASCSAGADFLDALMELELPGNVRQLENLVRQALVRKDDDSPLHLSDLPSDVWEELSEQRKHPSVQKNLSMEERSVQNLAPGTAPFESSSHLANLIAVNGWSLARSMRYCERLFLQTALHSAQGNQSETARILRITPRSVYNKIRKHALDR
jgi:transcriptional regulator with PAS, ATPase and Fis domain